jgi:alcohol dehydrogenase class IV
VEAFCIHQPNKFSELFARQAITLIGENLPIALKDGSNLKAREGLHLAATMASISILARSATSPTISAP